MHIIQQLRWFICCVLDLLYKMTFRRYEMKTQVNKLLIGLCLSASLAVSACNSGTAKNTANQSEQLYTQQNPPTDTKFFTIDDSVITKFKPTVDDETVENVVIPYKIVKIGNDAFKNIGLKTVMIGENVVDIGSWAFSENPTLNSIKFWGGSNNRLTKIGDYAFFKSGITEVVIPDNVVTIGDSAFKENKNLKKVTIGKNIKTIEQGAFTDNKNLEELIFNGSDDSSQLKTIGIGAFYGSGIRNLSIPDSVVNIGSYAFAGPFKGDNFSDNVGLSKLHSIKIGKNVKNISNHAFDNAYKLSSIIFHDHGKLETIGEGAFYRAAITKLKIPDSVRSIAQYAFAANNSLEKIIIGANVTEIEDLAFEFRYYGNEVSKLTDVLISKELYTKISDRVSKIFRNRNTEVITFTCYTGNDHTNTVACSAQK